MLNAYEQRLAVSYLSNAASRFHYRDPEAAELVDWLSHRGNQVVVPGRRQRWVRAKAQVDDGLTARRWRSLQDMLRTGYESLKGGRPDRGARRLGPLGRTVGLTPTDVHILEQLLRYRLQPFIEHMIWDVFCHTRIRVEGILSLRGLALSALLSKSAHAVQSRFGSDKPLLRSGLVSIDQNGDLEVPRRLHRLVTVPATDRRDVSQLLLDVARTSDLEWQDFDHVAKDRDYLERILEGALSSGERGVNVLLHGPPGTGKTEFCKVLARHLGVTLYSTGESDEEGGEPARGERLRELRLAQRLLAGQRNSLILLDEMEDVLTDPFAGLSLFGRSSDSSTPGSKVYLHRLLEETPAPTLWTMNNAKLVSKTILRRFMFACELRLTAAGVRQAVQHGVGSLSRGLGCDRPPQAVPERFDLSLVRSDMDPVSLVNRLAGNREQRFSLCLQKPPGTGKSALVRYLAECLGLKVVQKRASDLFSM